MNRLLFIVSLLLLVQHAQSQRGFLFVKRGQTKKKTYAEGERIYLQLKNDTLYTGIITQLRNDSIFLNGRPIPTRDVKAVIVGQKVKRKLVTGKDLLLITGGVALTTAGLSISKQATFKEALTAGLVIGYSPLLLKYIGSKIRLKRLRYKIGKKFRLQMIDFHIPRTRRAF